MKRLISCFLAAVIGFSAMPVLSSADNGNSSDTVKNSRFNLSNIGTFENFNIIDLIFLKRSLIGWSNYELPLCETDLNNNGEFDMEDIVLMKKVLVKVTPSESVPLGIAITGDIPIAVKDILYEKLLEDGRFEGFGLVCYEYGDPPKKTYPTYSTFYFDQFKDDERILGGVTTVRFFETYKNVLLMDNETLKKEAVCNLDFISPENRLSPDILKGDVLEEVKVEFYRSFPVGKQYEGLDFRLISAVENQRYDFGAYYNGVRTYVDDLCGASFKAELVDDTLIVSCKSLTFPPLSSVEGAETVPNLTFEEASAIFNHNDEEMIITGSYCPEDGGLVIYKGQLVYMCDGFAPDMTSSVNGPISGIFRQIFFISAMDGSLIEKQYNGPLID